MSHLAFSHLFFSQLSNRFRCSFRHLLSIHVIDVYVLCISDKIWKVSSSACIDFIFQTLIRLFVDPKQMLIRLCLCSIFIFQLRLLESKRLHTKLYRAKVFGLDQFVLLPIKRGKFLWNLDCTYLMSKTNVVRRWEQNKTEFFWHFDLQKIKPQIP